MAFYRRLVKPSGWKKLPWKAALQSLGIIVGTVLVIGIFLVAIAMAWISHDLPDPNTLSTREIPQSTKIYDRGSTHLLYELHGDENRTLIKIGDIPSFAKWATIAIEDKDFYQHHGIYWQGWIRALLTSVFTGKRVQGTSTLTQQLVKNAILTSERTFTRKIKEVLLALQIERVYTKDQILQLYFNEIPYGSTIYGIESASQNYFGKSAKDLTLDEAALLAAIPQAPDTYSPYGTGSHGDNRPTLVGREHHILDLMTAQGYITAQEATDAKAVNTLAKIKPKSIGNISAPHFVMYVRSMLNEKYGQKVAEQGGLKVTTTLDWDKQVAADEEVKKGVAARGKQYKFTNAALVSLDPKTGQILAMVGSADFFATTTDGQVNVTLSPRQPGSSFKPIVYAVGFMKGFLPQTMLWDVATTFKATPKDYAPSDYDGKERGPISIRSALQGSLNLPAVKMLYLAGVGRVLDFAETLGYTTFTDRSRFGLSLVLGGGEVKPLEHADAYAAFATEGIHYPTSAILKVEDPNGKVLDEWTQPDGTRVMEPQIARLVSNILSDNDARSYIFGAINSLTLPDRPVAAKTGTTNNYHDAWTSGYTPNLVATVWVGNNDNAEMKKGADGSVVAAPIWQAYMKRATKGMPIEKFTNPDPPTTDKPVLLGQVVQQKIKIDTITGKRATEYTPPELIEERTYYEAHDILYYVDKDDPAGPAPTNPATDPQFANWEAAVQMWVAKTGWNTTSTAPTEYDTVHVPGQEPQVTIVTPAANQEIPTREISISANVTGFQPITRVEVLMDDVPLTTLYAAPWTGIARIPNSLDKGGHTLLLRAFDSVGNYGATSITVNLTAEPENGGDVVISTPTNNTIWSRTSFPHFVDVQTPDPTLYSRVDAYFIGSDGVRRQAGAEFNPSANPIHISVPLGPTAGRYRLVVVGTGKDGARVDQSEIFVSITE